MSSFVDMSFSVNSAICRQYTETRKGDLAVGGNEIEISPGREDLLDASVYAARVDNEFIFNIKDGDFGLFYRVWTTSEDIG